MVFFISRSSTCMAVVLRFFRDWDSLGSGQMFLHRSHERYGVNSQVQKTAGHRNRRL